MRAAVAKFDQVDSVDCPQTPQRSEFPAAFVVALSNCTEELLVVGDVGNVLVMKVDSISSFLGTR